MRIQILKIVVVLLVAGSGDTRPQKSDDSRVETSERSGAGWRGIRTPDVSHDIVRNDSRYTGTSGSNRKSYITYFRDSVDSSREHGAIVSRASDLATSKINARTFNARRSKLDDNWTSEFQATGVPSKLSRAKLFARLSTRIGAARNSSDNKPRGSSSESKTIHDDKAAAWIRSALASNKSFGLGNGRVNYSEKVDIDGFEKLRSDVSRNSKSTVDHAIPVHARRDFSANLPFSIDFRKTNNSNTTRSRQKSGSIEYNLANKDDTWVVANGSDTSSSKMTNVSRRGDHRDAKIRTNSLGLDSVVVTNSHDNLKSDVVIDSIRRGIRRVEYVLNNSEKSTRELETRPTLIQISKSGVAASHRKTFNRNFVKLRRPFVNRRNVSALNSKLKINNNVPSAVVQLKSSTKSHFAQQTEAAKKPDATFELTKNHYSPFVQKSPGHQTSERVGNKTRDELSAEQNAYLKNWPNEALESIEDLYNYERYTSSLEEESEGHQADDQPILLTNNDGYFGHPDPVLDSSVKKIIHWLRIPDISPNDTYFAKYDNQYHNNVYKPIESNLESIYDNFEPNRPSVGTEENDYKIVAQESSHNQNSDTVDYASRPTRWPSPTSTARPYVTSSSSLKVPSALTPSFPFDATLLKNKTVYNPTTHVTQNTVVHILNDDVKKPNVTVTQLKTPQSENAVSDHTVFSESLAESSPDLPQRPNVHIMFTSQKDENHKPSKQETNTLSSSDNKNCPTIMINTYTRVNNTIQSKEGCTDLNIIVNSHVLNTNVIRPSDGPTEAQQITSLATQSYGDANESNKYSEEIDDLSHQDSANSYVTASTGSYGSSPFDTAGPNDYYESQKNPVGIPEQNNPDVSQLSTVEVFQGTQISISGSNVPDAEATAGPSLLVADGPAEDASVDGPAQSFVDSPTVESVDEPLSSAAVPPVGGTPVAGSPSSINSPVSTNVPSGILNSPGTVMGQANNGPAPGSLQLPALPSLPSRPGAAPGSSSSGSSSLSDDDDDEDDFDMSPGGVLESIASIFTYFSFMNPLGYSFFSLAAAPFAAMAAGVLGVAAVAFPWALPSVLDFGRAADTVTIRFRPNLEEFVRRAVHKYDRLNEWKSRRRKRRITKTLNIGQLNGTRDLKDLQYMDQSLRTVATQLLNVTDVIKVNNKELTKIKHDVVMQKPSEKNNVSSSSTKEVSSESVGLSFGRPINSKFSYFENSHPGQAMAITEEELEREMSTTRLITAYKNNPTTTGGISTWILLNPPSTTVKSAEVEKIKLNQPFQTEVRLTVRPSSSIEKVETISQPEKIPTTPLLTPVITTEKVTASTKKPIITTTKKITTTSLKPERVTQHLKEIESSSSTTLKIRTTTASTSTSDEATSSTTVHTTKKNQGTRTTSKPKVTTPKSTSQSKPATTKPTRPNQQRPKPTPTRRTTVKPETKNETSASTGKIEKVTFKPVQIITNPHNKPENTERPMFVTKIKASVLMNTQKTSTSLPSVATTTSSSDPTSHSSVSIADLVEVPIKSKPTGTKVNNVLKVQLKKPAGSVDETTQIEIEPIKVNAPILKIEKVDKDKMDKIVEKDTDDFSNSRIDLKFDFNPELTKINVETQTEATTSTTTTTTTTTTTKRPRQNSKRKKNKVRRRKRPSSTTSLAPSSTTATMSLVDISESVTDTTVVDNEVQESKIAPETKVAPNPSKKKKTQPQKTISTQIYNFLSREVMPSFGVMSLVGLGLGLASYFLYPFGGTISRRNYEVEPNYKYNLDEYGSNYGQSEEEVLSKVFQGMTNYDNKYPRVKDLNGNYYQYQHYDGAYDTQTTKKLDARYPVSTSPVYRPVENTQSAVKYRNTDFRYSSDTTPVYYDRNKHLDLREVPGSADRQFVVGNIPKEYPYDVKAALPIDGKAVYVSTEIGQTQFERDIAQGYNFPPNSGNLHNYGHLDASTIRPDDAYEEIEITPTAVAVEHGPRALKVKRDVVTDDRHSRSKRESVIQIIPSRHEIEEEREEMENEEDLSNEILDIIDSALPGGHQQQPHKSKHINENNEVEDLEGQKKKHQEEANTRAKESATRNPVRDAEDATNVEGVESTSKIVEKANENSSSENSSENNHHSSTTSSSKDSEDTTVEWFDSSTTKRPTEGFSLFNFVKKVAEIKFRLGLTILKHASEGFARYLTHVQKRINGEE
ncbi:uncharacterized protein LOC109853462 [Pseudomyrmex gracilis]|uniref:uncharacterized protein LOC109853462 n=1 Tax=Pseudomyrmex gracilis TaxID=219809 RepID=UPI000995D8BB|nr:uncharacterized protein LOC109853462 [Pseudomyrmex gracilis]